MVMQVEVEVSHRGKADERFESARSRHFEKPPAKNLYVTRRNQTMSPAKILCHV
jgi:hypothetical protein